MATDYKKRAELMREMRDAGKTLQYIGDVFDLTRERVRQILDTKYKKKRSVYRKAVDNSA